MVKTTVKSYLEPALGMGGQSLVHSLDFFNGMIHRLLTEHMLSRLNCMNSETEDFARSLGVKKIYKDYKEILADPEIGAVLVCSSTDTHAAISIEAIERLELSITANAPLVIFMVIIAVSTSPCSPMAGSTSTADCT